MSYKSVKMVELTSFLWKNLVKLILKTSFLCNNDWIMIVEKSNSFPSLVELDLGILCDNLENNLI